MRRLWLGIGLLCLCGALFGQYPFTYQGYLRQDGAPANGGYDFQFSLWTTQTGGTQIGSTQTRAGVTVQNGLFTVALDFGNVWDGSARFLQIAVRRAGTGAYITLLPRIRITGAPYALYAYKTDWFGIMNLPDDFADGVDNNTTYSAGAGLALTGTTFSIASGGVVSGMLADSAVTAAKLANGAVTTAKIGDNQVTDTKIVSVSWSKITGAPSFLTGVTAQTPLLGAGTASDPLRLRSGTAAGQVLRWNGSQWEPGEINLTGSAGGDLSGSYPNPQVAGLRGRAIAATAPSAGQVLKWSGSAWTPAPDEGRSYFAGAGLTLTGDTFSIAPGGVVSDMLADGTVTTDKIGDNQVTNAKIASVSWSKLTDIPSAGGDVSGTYPNLTVTRLRGNAVSSQTPSVGQVLKWTGSEWAPRPDETGGGASLWQQLGNNIYNTNVGNVGIGVTNPIYKLEISGDVRWTGTLQGGSVPWARITGAPNFLTGVAVSPRLRGDGTFSNPLDLAPQGAAVGQVLKWNGSAWVPQNDETGGSSQWQQSGSNIYYLTGNVGIGTSSPATRLHVSGTARVSVLEITGADLAEKFPVSELVQPGMVVEIDPNNPGYLRLARNAYSRRVVGVVAGANGLPTGVVLGHFEGSETHVPIAISGRVWVYADATEQAIEPGDLLTTSKKPGYAMAVRDRRKANGAILGKAMTRLEKGKTGLVLVFVNLQ